MHVNDPQTEPYSESLLGSTAQNSNTMVNTSIMSSEIDKQLAKVFSANGFIAALDQSGGSTPKALRLYGISDDAYVVGEESMYAIIHEMRARIMTSDSFNGDRILGSILFENTIDREVGGMPTAEYLWKQKHVVPFLKVRGQTLHITISLSIHF
jgi:fructose-bisphosphate aldolase class 1